MHTLFYILVLAAFCALSDTKIVEQAFEGDTNDIGTTRRLSFQNGTISLTMPGERCARNLRNFYLKSSNRRYKVVWSGQHGGKLQRPWHV
jgi:hypothetical protein